MYKAIITVKVSEDRDPSELEITLMPSDEIVFADGRVKALQDCTLAELQMVAEMFEAELQDELRDSTLFDLMIDGLATVQVNTPEEESVEPAMFEFWLDQYVILPEPADHENAKSGSDQEVPLEDEAPDDDDLAEDLAGDLVDDHDQPGEAPAETPPPSEETHEPTPPSEKGKPDDSEPSVPETEGQVSDSDELTAEKDLAPPEEESLVAETGETFPTDIDEGQSEHVFVPELTRVRILGKRRPQNHPTWTAVDILMNEPAFRDAQAHAISSPDKEVAGVLVGPQPEKQPDGRYVVHISDTIIAKHTRMHGASVTYTPESWRYVSDVLNERYPDEEAVIVGWYHTHPGFGIFLSSMDQFIHYNFFTQQWHIAFVLDPVNRKSGFFCWDRQHKNVDRYQFPWPKWANGSW